MQQHQQRRALLLCFTLCFVGTYAQLAEDFDGLQVNCWVKQCQVGDLLADAIRESAGTEISFVNGGGIRASLDAGPLSVITLKALYPFDNAVVKFGLLGSHLQMALEYSVSGSCYADGRFLQVSGLTFIYNSANPVGSKVTSILVGGSPVDLSRTYTVAVNSFVAGGGDGFAAFKLGRTDQQTISADEHQTVTDYVAAHSPVHPNTTPRITDTNTVVAVVDVCDSAVVGVALEWLDGSRASCWNADCALGRITAAALLREGKKGRSSVSIALTNSGGLRSSLPAGPITLAALKGVDPFDNKMVAFDLPGAALLAVLEHGTSLSGRAENCGQLGVFLQVAGLNFTFDCSKPAGTRVSNVFVGSAPLNLQTIYGVVSNKFLYSGGDNYDFTAATNVISLSGKIVFVVSSYLKTFSGSAISAPVGHAITGDASTCFGFCDSTTLFLTSETLSGGAVCSEQQCGVGILIADALRAYANRFAVADVAFENSGAIHYPLLAGNVTDRALAHSSPFLHSNTVVVSKVKGSGLISAMEHGVGRAGACWGSGRLPQVSGLSYTFDCSKYEQERITSLTLTATGHVIDPAAVYTVATNSFIAAGGDDFTLFPAALEQTWLDASVLDAIIDTNFSSFKNNKRIYGECKLPSTGFCDCPVPPTTSCHNSATVINFNFQGMIPAQ